jgi:alginate O-acetyltransferase complex protein AlgI
VLFNSYTFLFVFLPVTLGGWWALRGRRGRFAFLTLASYLFYAWWDIRFLPLLAAVTLIDFAAARAIERSADHKRRKALLVAAVSSNLALLFCFKYLNYAATISHRLADSIGLTGHLPVPEILLPIGISFYTLNAISYTVDTYRGVISPTRDLLRFSAFVAMFPHLIAGPIVRYADIQGQLRFPRIRLSWDFAYRGMFFIVIGLAEKVLVADVVAPSVDALFRNPEQVGLLGSWLAAFGYPLQLFFDFSGYSDMAVGLALLLGFRFPQNFDAPLTARNISEFWRRWNMTLSRFIRDYVYIPLGGSRGSTAKTARNLIVTMSIAGLWHGAGTPFLAWGLYNGALLAGHATLRERGLVPTGEVISRALTLLAVVLGFVVFRSPTMGNAGDMFEGMLGLHGLGIGHPTAGAVTASGIGLIVALAVAVQFLPSTFELNRRLRTGPRPAIALGVLGAAGVLALAHPASFVYFQF